MNITFPDINSNLKRFNAWWDIFILEAIKPVAILSMGLGTVAIFNLQGLAINPWFVVSWAIVQAASIDGLFFATWDRLFSQKLIWKNTLAIAALAFIGLVLALVAIAINAVLGFQVLWAIADSQNAMSRLGISPALFTAIRAVLAVVVFVMISFVRARARDNETVAISPIRKAHVSRVVSVRESKPLELPAVAQSTAKVTSIKLGMIEQRMYDEIMKRPEEAKELNRLSQEMSIDDFTVTLQQKYSQYAGYITPERVANVMRYVDYVEGQNELKNPLATSHKKELIRNALTEKVATGEKINMRVLADEIEVSYSYVKLVKKELGIE